MSLHILKEKSNRRALWCVRAAQCGVLAGLTTFFCTGCLVIPIHKPTRAMGANGLAPEQIDITFIQDGVTTREEVLQRLGWMDMEVKNTQFFVGRWVSSEWGVFWAATSEYQAGGGWNRSWNRQTLLIGFDSKNLVRQHQVVQDKDLTWQFASWLEQYDPEPLSLSTPVEIPVEDAQGRKTAALILESDGVAYRPNESVDKHARKRTFQVLPEQISSNGVACAFVGQDTGGKPDPSHLLQTITFSKKTPVGKKLMFRADMPTVVVLFKYFAQTRASRASDLTTEWRALSASQHRSDSSHRTARNRCAKVAQSSWTRNQKPQADGPGSFAQEA
jgi:hypothetical protein